MVILTIKYYLKIVKLLVESPSHLPFAFASSQSIQAGVQTNRGSLSGEALKGNKENSSGLIEIPLREKVELSNVHSYLISILTVIILLFFIKPSIILNSSKLLTLSLFSI